MAREKAMATHSSVLAWRIPGMAEPGGLPSLGSHRVEHDQSDLAAAAAGSLELEREEGQKTFVLPLPAYFIFREGNRSSHTSQLVNIPYTLWFSHVLQTFFLVHFNSQSNIFDSGKVLM